MATLDKHPLHNRSSVVDAALIEACGRVFASAHARSESGACSNRNDDAAKAVEAFLGTLAKAPTQG